MNTTRLRPRLSLRTALILFVLAGPFILAAIRLNEYRELSWYHSKVADFPLRSSDETRSAGPIPDSIIILVRKDESVGAFIPTSQTIVPEQVTYEWLYRTDGKHGLSARDPAVKSGRATATSITFGPFSIEWSGSDKGWGWVYYDDADDPQQLCVTGRQSFIGLNPDDEKWDFRPHPR